MHLLSFTVENDLKIRKTVENDLKIRKKAHAYIFKFQ